MSLPRRLVIVHGARARSGSLDHLVRVAVGELGLGHPAGHIRHHCPACGSSSHGRPSLAAIPGEPDLHLSLARCPDRSVVALTDVGPVGIDIERSGAARHGEVGAVLGVRDGGDATRQWVRAEALAKATGSGLVRHDERDPHAGPVLSRDLALGAYELAVAVLTSSTDLEIRVIAVGTEAASR